MFTCSVVIFSFTQAVLGVSIMYLLTSGSNSATRNYKKSGATGVAELDITALCAFLITAPTCCLQYLQVLELLGSRSFASAAVGVKFSEVDHAAFAGLQSAVEEKLFYNSASA